MSDAPERLWLLAWEWDDLKFKPDHFPSTEYIRADLAGLPEELVERIKDRAFKISYREPEGHTAELLGDILAWHEQQKEGKE